MEQSNRPIKGKKSKNKKKKRNCYARKLILLIVIFLLIIIIFNLKKNHKIEETSEDENEDSQIIEQQHEEKPKQKIDDWRLALANYDNILPEDFEVELANIDKDRQFDARAIKDLNQMMNDMREDGITNIWVQSAYRSVKSQKKLYDKSIKKYLEQGKSQEEAEKLTLEYINKPGSSDHNLGLAVDFNYVENSFEEMEGYKWLTENAEKYGFVLRYPKDKEDITKIAFESWHWRYVGEEHAKKMNELNMCLEEYVSYLIKKL